MITTPRVIRRCPQGHGRIIDRGQNFRGQISHFIFILKIAPVSFSGASPCFSTLHSRPWTALGPSPLSLIVSCYTLSAKVQVCAISQLIVQEEQIKNLAREQREVTEDLAQLRPYNKHRGNRLRQQAGQAKPGVERLIRKYKTGSITKPAVYPCRQNVDDRLQCVGGDSDAKSTTRFRGAG